MAKGRSSSSRTLLQGFNPDDWGTKSVGYTFPQLGWSHRVHPESRLLDVSALQHCKAIELQSEITRINILQSFSENFS